MQSSADTPLPGNGGVAGAVYSLPFGAQLPDPFATCADAGSHLTRLSVPRFCGYSFCSRLLSYSVVRLCQYTASFLPCQDYCARKFAKRALPLRVMIDSGWNCTPSTGIVRCRRPIIRPSSVHAVTSSSGGQRQQSNKTNRKERKERRGRKEFMYLFSLRTLRSLRL